MVLLHSGISTTPASRCLRDAGVFGATARKTPICGSLGRGVRGTPRFYFHFATAMPAEMDAFRQAALRQERNCAINSD